MLNGAPADTTQGATTPEIDEAELKRFNQAMIESDLITSDRLYMDLALCKDYAIGALLSFLPAIAADRRPAVYQSLLDGLPAYQTRKFDDIAHYFPHFGVSNDAVRNRLRDPGWASYILHHAPVTPYIKVLSSQIAVNANHSAVIGKRDPIELTINTYPLQINRETDRHIIGLYFSQLLRVTVKVIYLDLGQLNPKDVLPYDEIYSYYYNELFQHQTILDAYAALKFIRKRLFVPRLFGLTLQPKLNTDHEELIIKSRYDVLTMFTYVPTKLCSALAPDA